MLNRIRRALSPPRSATSPFSTVSLAPGTTFVAPELGEWYTPVLIGADVIGDLARSVETLDQVIALLDALTPDPYVDYLKAFYSAGRQRFGVAWRYADITTALMAAGRLVRPLRYLEIGVRRGRSMAMVAATNPDCVIVGMDMWLADYAGIENPGPEFVRSEMARVGYRGALELIEGDSHEALPAYFSANPEVSFDLVTVDGDHTLEGAARDLKDVLPHIAVGGVLVFDDIQHPAHPGLDRVWRDIVARNECCATWHYRDVGYGVAIAVRRA